MTKARAYSVIAGTSGNGLGLRESSFEKIQHLFPTKSFGQAGINIYPNVANGNVVVQDRFLNIREKGGKNDLLNIGFTYNSQAASVQEAWHFSLDVNIKDINNNSSLTYTSGDGHQTTYTFGDQQRYFAPDGVSYIEFDGKANLWRRYDAKDRSVEYFNTQGQRVQRVNNVGQALSFSYNGNQTIITGSAGDTYQVTSTSNAFNGQTIGIYETTGGENNLLQQSIFDHLGRLQTTSLPLNGNNAGYQVNYSYREDTSLLSAIAQTDTTNVSFMFTGSDNQPKRLANFTFGKTEEYDVNYNGWPEVTITGFAADKFTIDANGNLAQCALPEGPDSSRHTTEAHPSYETKSYSYYPNGQIQQITYADGTNESFVYTVPQNLLLQHTKRNGHVTTYIYGSGSDYAVPVCKLKYPGPIAGNTPVITRDVYNERLDQYGNVIQYLCFSISPIGKVTEYRYDDSWNIASIRTYLDSAFPVAKYNVHPEPVDIVAISNWASQQSPQKVSLVDYLYDPNGQVYRKRAYAHIDAEGNGIVDDQMGEEITDKDIFGCLLVHQIKQSATTVTNRKQAFDGLQRVTRITDQMSMTDPSRAIVKTVQYSDAKAQTQITQPNGRVDVTTVDTAGEVIGLTQQVDNTVRTTTYLSDTLGRPVITQLPDGRQSFTFYDFQQRLGFTVTPMGDLASSFAGAIHEYRYNSQYRFNTKIHYDNTIDIRKLWLIYPPLSPTTLPTIDTLIMRLNTLNIKNPAKDRYSYEFFMPGSAVLKQYEVDEAQVLTEYRYNVYNEPTAVIRYKTALTDAQLTQLKNGQSLNLTPDPTKDRCTRYFYNDDGKKIGEQDAAGYITQYIRNAGGQLMHQITFDDKQPINFAQNNFDEIIEKIKRDPNKDVHHYYFRDARGQCYLEVDAEKFITTHEYLPCGLVHKSVRYQTKVDDAWWVNSINSINSTNPTAAPIPVPSTQDLATIHDYDLLNRVTALINTDNQANPTELKGEYTQYDVMNNVTFHQVKDLLMPATGNVNDPDHQRNTQSKFNGWGQKVAEANPYITQLLMDIENNPDYSAEEKILKKAQVWQNSSIRHVYDNTTGLLLKTITPSETNPQGDTTYFYYDQNRKPVIKIDPTGAVIQETLNTQAENILERKYATRFTPEQIKTLTGGFISDAFRATLTGMQTPKDEVIAQKRDKRGLVEQITDAMQNVSKKVFSAFRQCIQDLLPVNSQQPTLAIDHGFDTRGLETSTKKTDTVSKLVTETKAEFENIRGKQTAIIDADGNKKMQSHDRLGNKKDHSYVDENNDIIVDEKLTHDAWNRVTTSTDAEKNTTSHERNQQTRTDTITYPTGAKEVITSNFAGEQVAQETQGLNNPQTWTHSPGGQIAEHTDAENNTTKDKHSLMGLLVEHENASKMKTSLTHNGAGALIKKVVDTEREKLTTAITPDAFGNAVLITDPRDVVSAQQYDLNNNLQQVIVDPTPGFFKEAAAFLNEQEGQETVLEKARTQHNDTAFLFNEKILRNMCHQYFVEHKEEVKQGSLTNGKPMNTDLYHLVQNTFEEMQRAGYADNYYPGRLAIEGKILSIVLGVEIELPAHLNLVTNKTYNAQNKEISMTKGDTTTPVQYEETDQVDGLNRNTGNTKDPGGLALSTQETLDGNGNVVAKKDANGNVTHNWFNTLNKKRFIVSAVGGVVEYEYYKNGEEKSERHYEKGIDPSKITDTTTIAQIKAMLIQDPLDTFTLLLRDGNGNIRFKINNVGAIEEYRYNGANKEIEKICYATKYTDLVGVPNLTLADVEAFVKTNENKKDRHTYVGRDKNGRAQFIIDPRGVVTEQVFLNDTDKVIAKIVNDEVTFQIFDSIGRSQFIVSPAGVVTQFEHDENNNLTQRCVYDKKVELPATYAELVTLLNTWVPNPKVDLVYQYEFDAANRKVVVTDPLGNSDVFDKDALGNTTTHTDRNGNAWQYKYDDAERLTVEITPPVDVTSVVPDPANPGKYKAEKTDEAVAIERHFEYDGVGNAIHITAAKGLGDERALSLGYSAVSRRKNASVANAPIDDPTKVATFTAPPVKLATVSKKETWNAKNLKVVEYDESVDDATGAISQSNYQFTIYDANKKPLYEVNAVGAVKKLVRNSFGELIQSIIFENRLGIPLTEHIATGLPLALVENNLKPSEKDTVVTYDRNGNGDVELTQYNEEFFFQYDAVNPHYGFASPQTKFVRDASNNIIKTSQLIAPVQEKEGVVIKPAQWSDTWQWFDKDNHLLAKVNAIGKVIRYERDVRGNEISRYEYANPLNPLPTDEMTLAELDAIMNKNTSKKDRRFRFEYNLLNKKTKQTRVSVVRQTIEYALINNKKVPKIINLPPCDISQTWEYDAESNLLASSDSFIDDGSNTAIPAKKLNFYNALGNKVAKTDVPRKAPAQDTLAEQILVPLTHYGLNAHGQTVETVKFYAGTAFPVDPNNIPKPISTSADDDQHELSVRDNRGLPSFKQDGNGNVEGATFTAATTSKKIAREFWNLSAWTMTNMNALYDKDIVSGLIKLKVKHQLKGFLPGKQFVLNHAFADKGDGNFYNVAITPAVDARKNSMPITSYCRDTLLEILPILQGQENSHAKILIPYNVDKLRWQTLEIRVHRQGQQFTVSFMNHRPHGAGHVSKEMISKFEPLVKRTISEKYPNAQIRCFYLKNNEKPRQAPEDMSLHGAVVVEDIMQLATGATLNCKKSFLINALEIRQVQADFVNQHTDENDRFRQRLNRKLEREGSPRSIRYSSDDVIHVDERQTKYTEADQAKKSILLRDNVEQFATESEFDTSGRQIAEGPGDGTFPKKILRTPRGLAWSSPLDSGAPQLILHDLKGNKTGELQSPTINLGADNIVSQTQIPELLTMPLVDIELTATVRNNGGQIIASTEPARWINESSATNIPLTFCVNEKENVFGKQSVTWVIPQETTLIPQLTVWPLGTNSTQVLPIQTNKDLNLAGVDVSSLTTDCYQFEIDYFVLNPITKILELTPQCKTEGIWQFNTNAQGVSYNVVGEIKSDSTLYLTGNTAGLTAITLYQGPTKIAGPLAVQTDPKTNALYVDLNAQPSGQYTYTTTIYDIESVAQSLPITIYTNTPATQPLSREIPCSLEVLSLNNNVQVNWVVPEAFKNKPVQITCVYVDTNNKEQTQTATITPGNIIGVYTDQKGDKLYCNAQLANPVLKIKSMSLSVQGSSNDEWIPLYVDEQASQPKAGSNDIAGVIQQTEFSDLTILYVSPYSTTEKTLPLSYLNTSLDTKAKWTSISEQAITPYGFSINATGMPEGSYPFGIADSGKLIGTLTISHGGSLYLSKPLSPPKKVAKTPTTSYEPNVWDKSLKTTDPLLNTVENEYNDESKKIKSISPAVNVGNEDGSVTKEQLVTQTGFDIQGRDIGKINAEGNSRVNVLDEAGQKIAEISETGRVIQQNRFNALSQNEAQTDSRGETWANRFDNNSNLVKEIAPSGLFSEYSVDQRNQRNFERDPAGNIRRLNHNANNDIELSIAPEDPTGQILTNYTQTVSDRNHQTLSQTGVVVEQASIFALNPQRKGRATVVRDQTYNRDYFSVELSAPAVASVNASGIETLLTHNKKKEVIRVQEGPAGIPLHGKEIFVKPASVVVQEEDSYGNEKEVTINGMELVSNAVDGTFLTPSKDLSYVRESGLLLGLNDNANGTKIAYDLDLNKRKEGLTVTDGMGAVIRSQKTRFDALGDTEWDMDQTLVLVQSRTRNRKLRSIWSVVYDNNWSPLISKTRCFKYSDEGFVTIGDGVFANKQITIIPGQGTEYDNENGFRVSEAFINASGVLITKNNSFTPDGDLYKTIGTDGSYINRSYATAGYMNTCVSYDPATGKIKTHDVLCNSNGWQTSDIQSTSGKKTSTTVTFDWFDAQGNAKHQFVYYNNTDPKKDAYDNIYNYYRAFGPMLKLWNVSGMRYDYYGRSLWNTAYLFYDSNGGLNAKAKSTHHNLLRPYETGMTSYTSTPDGVTLNKMVLSPSTNPYLREYNRDLFTTGTLSEYFYGTNNNVVGAYSTTIDNSGTQLVANIDFIQYGQNAQGSFELTHSKKDAEYYIDKKTSGWDGKYKWNGSSFFERAPTNQTYKPAEIVQRFSQSYPPPVPGTYFVQEGDTFERIAQLFGSENFASLIAHYNGDSVDTPLEAGQTIRLPQLVDMWNGVKDNEPYQQFMSMIIGTVYPHLDTPQPSQSSNIFEEIALVIVIAVCIAFGQIELAAAFGALGAALMTAAIVFLADAAVQEFFVLGGVQKGGVNFKEAAEAGIEAGLAVGFAPAATGPMTWEMAGEMALDYGTANVLGQLSAMALGLQSRINAEQIMDAVVEGFVAQGIDAKIGTVGSTLKPFEDAAVNTVADTGLDNVIEGNNISAKQLLVQMIGAEAQAGASLKFEKDEEQKKAQQAQQKNLTEEVKATGFQGFGSSLEINSTINNQGGMSATPTTNTTKTSGIKATSQSSLNAGASALTGVTGSWNTPSTPTRVSAGSSSGFWSGVASLGRGTLETASTFADKQAPGFANDMNMHYQNSMSLMQEIQSVDIRAALDPLADMENLAGLKQGLVQDLNVELQLAQESGIVLNASVFGGNMGYASPALALGFGIIEYEQDPTIQNLMQIGGGIAGGATGVSIAQRVLFGGGETEGLLLEGSLSDPWTAAFAAGYMLSTVAISSDIGNNIGAGTYNLSQHYGEYGQETEQWMRNTYRR